MNTIEQCNVEMALAILSRIYTIKAHTDAIMLFDSPYTDIRDSMFYLEKALNGDNKLTKLNM